MNARQALASYQEWIWLEPESMPIEKSGLKSSDLDLDHAYRRDLKFIFPVRVGRESQIQGPLNGQALLLLLKRQFRRDHGRKAIPCRDWALMRCVIVLLFMVVGSCLTGGFAVTPALAHTSKVQSKRPGPAYLLGISSKYGAGRQHRGPSAHSSVVGGEVAQPGAFPWMAFVIDFNGEETSACSGSVVAPNLVLTAAHCAVNLKTGVTDEASGYRVVTGTVDWASSERQVSDVSRVLPFPHFKFKEAPDGFGDAALLVLSTPTTAPAIRLATSTDTKLLRTGTHAMIAGWGETYYGQDEPTEWLMWAKTMLEGKHCEGLLGRICAIDFPRFTSGPCHGDSGGPLLAAGPRGQGLIEIGITQAGFGECWTTRPGIFTRADLVSSWVARWISALKAPP
jgi:hypothetical protein